MLRFFWAGLLLLTSQTGDAYLHPIPTGLNRSGFPSKGLINKDLSDVSDSLETVPTARYSEGILAQVGDKIILRSELESEVRNTLNQ